MTKYLFLTPFDNADKDGNYSDALNQALDDDKVRNIAISGSYGSGKSSFIHTFEKNNDKWKFLDISLASFSDSEEKGKGDDNIEKSILQQMFYKVKSSELPQSRFKRISTISNCQLFGNAATILLNFLAYLILFHSNQINELIKVDFSNIGWKWTSSTVLIISLFLLIKKLLIVFSNINFEKINLKNLELTTNTDDTSLLNKYLDEILYFFQSTSYNVVVFQDLDRLNNPLPIFTKLRELNKLINSSDQKEKRVVFLYAVKDDMFKDESNNRTKFFDFIIPIIPYINPSNSYDKLLEIFEDSDLDKNFLSEISLYIDDMRLLKNIVNEYYLYTAKIGKKLNSNKLLAILLYKNFYPDDFSDLHKNKGIVFTLFNTQSTYVETLTDKYLTKIKVKENELENIENEFHNEVIELKKVYLLSIISKTGLYNNSSLNIPGKGQVSIEQILTSDVFTTLKKSTQISNPHNHLSITFSEIENEINATHSYNDREQLILNKSTEYKDKLTTEIQEIIRNINALIHKTIQELATLDPTIFNTPNFEGKELLIFLLKNGHISEDYHSYISYDFENSISSNDRDFLRSITNNTPLELNYPLDNLSEISKENRIRIRYYSEPSILNVDLVEHLIKNEHTLQEHTLQEQYKTLFVQLSNGSDNSNKFIFNYIKERPEDGNFLISIAKHYNQFWLHLIHHDSFTLDSKITYFQKLLDLLQIDNLIRLNIKGSLSLFSSELRSLPTLSATGSNNFKNLIDSLDIQFLNLKDVDRNPSLFKKIYEDNNYILSPEIIKVIFTQFKSEIPINTLDVANLTTIRSTELQHLNNRIDSNLDTYIKNIFLKIDSNTEESEETIANLLNNEKLDKDLKRDILLKESNKIVNLSAIEDANIWPLLFELNKIEPRWDNILHYYDHCSNEIDEDLINYLNNIENAEVLSQTKLGKSFCDNNDFFDNLTIQELLKSILLSNNLNTETYKSLISNITFWYSGLDISMLDGYKVQLLLNTRKFQFTIDNYDNLKKYTNDKHIALIEQFISEFIDKFEEFHIDSNDATALLSSNVIDKHIKVQLINKLDVGLINPVLAQEIYPLLNFSKTHNYLLISSLIEHLDSLEKKLNIIIKQSDNLSNEEILDLLNFLPKEYSDIALQSGKKPVLNKSTINIDLAEILQSKGLITSYKYTNNNELRVFIKDNR